VGGRASGGAEGVSRELGLGGGSGTGCSSEIELGLGAGVAVALVNAVVTGLAGASVPDGDVFGVAVGGGEVATVSRRGVGLRIQPR
jgi:hypothetical protein